MDIYSFVNSSAIREHLKSINYQFNSLETAWLVYQCQHISLSQKYEAWNEIIETMEDCTMSKNQPIMLHEYLKKYMECMKKQYANFQKQETGAVYQYTFYCKDDFTWCEDFHSILASEQDCWKEIDEDSDLGIERILIRKYYVGKNYIEVDYRLDRTVMDIYSRILSDEEFEICNLFDTLWFDFPVPFQKGDILVEKRRPAPSSYGSPFVMQGITPWETEYNERRKKSGMLDSSDMNAWGLFQDDDGRIYNEVMCNYMDLEYYKEPKEGKERLLYAIGAYLKEEISLSLLLTTYRKVILDEFIDDPMLSHWYGGHELEKVGLLVSKKQNHDS